MKSKVRSIMIQSKAWVSSLKVRSNYDSTRIIKLFFICSNFLIIGAVFGFGDNKTAYYEPAQVELTGIVNEMLFPGPPNYNSIDNGDVAEYGWYITLARIFHHN